MRSNYKLNRNNMKKTLKMAIWATLSSSLFLTIFAGNLAYAQTASSTIPLCEITRSLTVGSSGEDVRCLQRYLNWSGFTVAASGTGSPGSESLYFGGLTKSAVMRWQNANSAQVLVPLGITTGTGYWGSASFNYYVTIVRAALGV